VLFYSRLVVVQALYLVQQNKSLLISYNYPAQYLKQIYYEYDSDENVRKNYELNMFS